MWNKNKMTLIFDIAMIFFFFVKQTHTQGRGKWVLTQRHVTTPLKSHGNFKGGWDNKFVLIMNFQRKQFCKYVPKAVLTMFSFSCAWLWKGGVGIKL